MSVALNIPDNRKHHLNITAKVYDIGKLAIPHEILYAPRQLNKEETFEVQQHVNIGVQEILRFHKIFRPILSLVKFHHERWDGSGYPWELKQEEIPLESRMLGIVDTFKAMITERPYRQRLHLQDAVREIVQLKGSLFDPNLVSIFVQILQSLKKP